MSQFNLWQWFREDKPSLPVLLLLLFYFFIIVPVTSLCSQRWKRWRALMMHYHRSENEPRKSPWHSLPHNASKTTAAFLKDAAYPQSKRVKQGNTPVGFCQNNHLFLSPLLGQLRPCLVVFSLLCFQ